MKNQKKYFAAISTFIPFGSARIEALLNFFETPEIIWKASKNDLISTGLSENLVDKFLNHRQKVNPDNYFGRLKSLKIDILVKSDYAYPSNLTGIKGAPYILYVKGKIIPSDDVAIAIVGTRKMTNYGRDVCEFFAKGLASSGMTIISGLARGVDSVAHSASLAAGGRTIAVIGCGLDNIYPASNFHLAQKIIENGAIISEYPLGYPALRSNFGARNRIISGLSKGVVVVEGEKKSGTLLTATHAAEQGKTVYAVPGSIFSIYSQASHFLIQNGAQIVNSPRDIIADIGVTNIVSQEVHNVSPKDEFEDKIYSILISEALHMDELARITGLKIADISGKLTVMELKGMVKHIGNGVYRRV